MSELISSGKIRILLCNMINSCRLSKIVLSHRCTNQLCKLLPSFCEVCRRKHSLLKTSRTMLTKRNNRILRCSQIEKLGQIGSRELPHADLCMSLCDLLTNEGRITLIHIIELLESIGKRTSRRFTIRLKKFCKLC